MVTLNTLALMNMNHTGKCRIQISASGKSTEEFNFPIFVSGNTMRDIVGRIIDECVEARGRGQQTPWGGVGTKYIHRTLDWLVKRDTRFPESLDIRKSPASPALGL